MTDQTRFARGNTISQAILDLHTVYKLVGWGRPGPNMPIRISTCHLEDMQIQGIAAALKVFGWKEESAPYSMNYSLGGIQVQIVAPFDGNRSQIHIQGWR